MDNTTYIKLADAPINSTLTRPVLVTTIAENVARNGKTYLKITMKDGFTEQTANMFDANAAMLASNGITEGTIVDVELQISEYQGSKSFRVLSIQPTQDFSLAVCDFTKAPPISPDIMFSEICQMLESSAQDFSGKYSPLASLALDILNDNKSAFMTSSAAVSMHHNMCGGLIYHTYRMMKAADAISRIYTILDRELLLCGTALHDIGKVWEYSTAATGDAEVTVNGTLMGHLYMGASLIKNYPKERLTPFNKEKVQMLIHLILSHHGEQEFGAVVPPATPEAFVLHYIDNLDAKAYMCEDAYANLGAGCHTEKRPFGLNNRIYKPKYE